MVIDFQNQQGFVRVLIYDQYIDMHIGYKIICMFIKKYVGQLHQ